MWDAADVEKALAWREYERELCPECGTSEDDWVEHDEEGRTRYLDPPLYEAVPTRCFGCAAIENARAAVPSREEGGAGIKVPILAFDVNRDFPEAMLLSGASSGEDDES